MKICYLSDANSLHTKRMCNFFLNKGYDVEVVSLNDGEIEGVKVHSLNFDLDKVKNSGIYGKFKYFSKISKIKKILSEVNPDILHAHYASSYGLFGALTKFHPYIISVWGSDIYEFPKQNIINRKILEYNLSKADLILSTSKIMAKETKNYTDKNIEITPFGVDIQLYKPCKNKYKESNEIIIGTAKALEPVYGINHLIRAFKQLCDRNPRKEFKLEIAGIGSQYDYLNKLANDLSIGQKVKFLGLLNEKEVAEAFNRFDVAVFPSLSESFGVAAVEAQACGVPVIASNVGGLPEATCEGYSSILVESQNEMQLVYAIEKLADNENLRIQMGNNGRKYVEDNFNINDNYSKIEKLYIEILK